MTGNDSVGRVDVVMLPVGAQYSVIVINIGILIFGGLSSIMTACLVLRYPSFQRQFTYALIANQSIIDAMYLLLLLPMRLNTIVNLVPNTYSACALERYSVQWLITASSLCILFMAVARYIQIVHPKFYPRFNKKGIHIGIMLYIWIAPFLVQLIGITWPMHPNVVFNYVKMQCLPSDANVEDLLEKINIFIFYLPAVLVTLYCYIHIIIKVKMAQRKVKVINRGTSNQRSNRSENILTRTTFIIFTVYIILYTLPGMISGSFSRNLSQPMATIMSTVIETMYRTPPCIYVIVYATMNRQMKQGYKMILQCKRGKEIIIEDPTEKSHSNTNVINIAIMPDKNVNSMKKDSFGSGE